MALDPAHLLGLRFPERVHRFGPRDVILYALGVGAGMAPLSDDDLAYVREDELRVLPTFATVMGFVRTADLGLGIDMTRAVHAEQALTLHAELPTTGDMLVRTRIAEVVDLGVDKGALLRIAREVSVAADDAPVATSVTTLLCRADGGFTDAQEPSPARIALPDRAPDVVLTRPTSPQAALIYRLSGDRNPLHVDPAVASAAGFDRPILHGMATYGLACFVLQTAPGLTRRALHALSARFTRPLFPGEPVRIDLWQDATTVRFRVTANDRDVVVLDHGTAVFAA